MRFKYQGTFKDQAGNIITSGSITVYLAGTTTLATIYSAETGGSADSDSVVSSDSTTGQFEFWVDTLDYALTQQFKLSLTKANFSTTTYDEINIFPDLTYRYIVDPSETDQGAAGNGNTIKNLVDSIGTTNSETIFLPPSTTTYTLTTSETIPSNITLHQEPGAIIDGAGTLTVNGKLNKTLSQKFGSTLTLAGAPIIDNFPVQWRGATGDGSTDDTTEINQALDDVEAFTNHPPLYFPTTNQFYLVSASIDFTNDNPIVIMGDNYLTSVIKAVNASPFSDAVFTFGNTTHHKYVVFKNLGINCNSDAGYGVYGEYNGGSGGVSHTKFYNVRITGATTQAVHLEWGWNIEFKECTFTGNVGGIQVSNSANAVQIINTKVYGNTGIGIYLWGGYGSRIAGCTIESNDLGGIKIQAVSGMSINNNYFEENGNDTAGQRYAIWWGATSAYTYGGEIKANSIIGKSGAVTGLAGIVIDYAYGGEIAANEFFHLNYGIDMQALAAATIPKDLIIDSSNYFDSTVTTIWNPHATNEKYYSENGNRFFIPGTFERSTGNLLPSHPIDWTRTVANDSVFALVDNQYPAFTMTKGVGVNCYVDYTLDFSKGELQKLRGKYVSFGMKVSAASTASIYATLGTTSSTTTVDTSITNKIVTIPVATDETTVVMRIQVITESVAFTIYDVWLTEGVDLPSESLLTMPETKKIFEGSGLYNFSQNGGAIATYTLGSIPDNSTIIWAAYEVLSAPTSGGAATIAISTSKAANEIITATAYNDAIFGTGYHDGTQDWTAANYTTKTTADSTIDFTVAGAALTGGKIRVFWKGITSQ